MQNHERQAFLWQKILMGIIVLLVLIFGLNIFRLQIRNYFYLLYFNVSDIFLHAGKNTSGFLESLNFKKLENENNSLKKENLELLSNIFLLQESIRENQELKEVMENTQHDTFNLILAKVVGLDLQNDLMLINKGSIDGIFENMPLISSQKVLYGKVLKTYDNFSQVMLISNENSVFNVKIQEMDEIKNPIYGLIKGRGDLSLYLDTVSSESEIKENDVLITSALEGTFPSGLLVGKIKSINKNDLKPFQTAEIEQFFDINDIDNLFVVTNHLQN